jgi:hypothetical protein
MLRKDELKMASFKRKILRRIYGPKVRTYNYKQGVIRAI